MKSNDEDAVSVRIAARLVIARGPADTSGDISV